MNTAGRRAALVLAGITAAAWIYLLAGGGGAGGTAHVNAAGGMMMTAQPAWSLGMTVPVFGMWAIMMVAMMLPSAAPTIVGAAGPGGAVYAVLFTAGYLVVWTGFGLAATLLQQGLDSARLLSDTMAIRDAAIAGALIASIGLYQLSPMKRGCLRRCRTPDGDPVEAHGPGAREDAWIMVRRGLRYGTSCVGCCAAVMLLLFVGGVMNLGWMALIAVWAVLERRLPWGDRVARLIAAGLIAWGGIALAIAARA